MTASQPTLVARKSEDVEFANGDFTGDVTVAGDAAVTGDLAVTGTMTGASGAGRATQELTATGAVTITSGLLRLNHASTIIAATKAAPAIGDELIIVNTSASGTAAHTVTLPSGVTWDGTNRIATLNAPGEALHVIATSATRFFILENIGSVAFS